MGARALICAALMVCAWCARIQARDAGPVLSLAATVEADSAAVETHEAEATAGIDQEVILELI